MHCAVQKDTLIISFISQLLRTLFDNAEAIVEGVCMPSKVKGWVVL